VGLSNPLSALRNVSGSAVTIGDLISNEVWSLDPDEPAQDAAVAMAVMAFDRAVLREDPIERVRLASALW